jgi:predicted acylesterase/phospholipase RssA
MTVFVLSGGGNYGPLQVGALQVLMERSLRPDLLVGNSAGALNAASLVTDPTPRGVKRLADLWRSIAELLTNLMTGDTSQFLRCSNTLGHEAPG